jgi:hypothetical protein
VSRQLLFLTLIGLMLFVLAIAGQDRSPLAKQLTGAPVARVVDVFEKGDQASAQAVSRPPERAPASIARTLDIEPVEPGTE